MMSYPLRTLRAGDGLRRTTPELMPVVEHLQRALDRAGHTVLIDGRFGGLTESSVKAFQQLGGMVVDGVVGPATWRGLERYQRQSESGGARAVLGFETFHGDLAWVRAREGHAGKPYWPGGICGITLDPDFDLRFQTLERVRQHYGDLLTLEQEGALARAIGRRGTDARDLLRDDAVLRSIRVGREHALRVMPHIAVDSWQAIVQRFPAIELPDTPPSVQTVMLSLAYNRGAEHRELETLAFPIEAGDWHGLAARIAAMQQDHSLPGVRSRRRLEASLILDELDFTVPRMRA
jgi:hypothetical protein